MVSKSSGTLIWPLMKPNRFTFLPVGASSGTTLTIGLPALAMMKGSPLAALSMSLDRWVLAWWMLTVFMAAPSGLSLVSLVYLALVDERIDDPGEQPKWTQFYLNEGLR